MKKIYVIAGNYREFESWCQEKLVSRHSPLVHYVSEGQGPQAFYGTVSPEVVCVGTYRKRKDFFELENIVRERTRPVVQIVYVDKPEEPKKPVEYVQEFARKIAWQVVTG